MTPNTGADTIPAGADPFHRSSYAIKKDLAPGLKEVQERLKMSLAGILSMLADDPEQAERLLGAVAAEYRVKMATAPRSDTDLRQQRKSLKDKIKNADPATLARLVAALEANTEHG